MSQQESPVPDPVPEIFNPSKVFKKTAKPKKFVTST